MRNRWCQGEPDALVRVRHPTWGVVAPAYYIPAADDPYLHALSHFVIARALADSVQFAAANNPVRISVPLPLLALEDLQFIDRMLEKLPEKARLNGLLIAVELCRPGQRLRACSTHRLSARPAQYWYGPR